MEQEAVKKVMDEVMKRFEAASENKPEVDEAYCVPAACTEFIGTAMGHTIGLVIANVESRLHELMGIDKKYRSIGIISDRIGAGPQLMAADEAVKATNTEIVSAEMCRDTEGGCGHGALIIFGAEDVSDAKRAIEVSLKELPKF